MIAIASVQHTGTRFLRILLKPQTPTGAHFGQKFLYRLNGHKTITPLRELDKIIHSWSRRDMDLKHLHFSIGQMIDFKPDFYFPIDHEDRDEYLIELSEIIGRDLETDWSPQGNQDRNGTNNPSNPEYADIIREDYGMFFDQIYGRD